MRDEPCRLKMTDFATPPFLLSIDLEDVRDQLSRPEKHPDRVALNTDRYLEFFAAQGIRCTFFVVGTLAARLADLVARIVQAGHEIACHGLHHAPLDKVGPGRFEDELGKQFDILRKAGTAKPIGFRAPFFSLTETTAWAYPILKRAGIVYSSSVLPAANPIYGWPSAEVAPHQPINGLWEIPVSVGKIGPAGIAFGGGVYFRTIPLRLLKICFQRTLLRRLPVVGYFHPFDIDYEQEKFAHPGIPETRLFHTLMYSNRKRMFSKLEKILSRLTTMTYAEYIKTLAARDPAR